MQSCSTDIGLHVHTFFTTNAAFLQHCLLGCVHQYVRTGFLNVLFSILQYLEFFLSAQISLSHSCTWYQDWPDNQKNRFIRGKQKGLIIKLKPSDSSAVWTVFHRHGGSYAGTQVPHTQYGKCIFDTNLINFRYVDIPDHLITTASSAEHLGLCRITLAIIPFHDNVYTTDTLLYSSNQTIFNLL